MSMDTALTAFLDNARPGATLVASDFDGTLSDIVSVPEAAVPRPGVLELLAGLHRATLAVAILSGRSTADLRRLLPVPGLRLLGDYGRPEPTPEERRALQDLDGELRDAVGRLPGVTVERKPGSASVHHRASPELGPRLLAAVRPLARRHGLDAHAGRLVVEVVPGGWNKARALDALVRELRPGAVLFAGDDHGDREVFTYLTTLEIPHLGVGVSSRETPDEVFAACDLVVPGPAANVEVLRRLEAAWARPAPGPEDRAPAG